LLAKISTELLMYIFLKLIWSSILKVFLVPVEIKGLIHVYYHC